MNFRVWIAVSLVLLTFGLLYPGLTQKALTMRGYIDPVGAATLVEQLTAANMPPEEIAKLRLFLNPQTLGQLNDEALSKTVGSLVGTIAKGKISGAAKADLASTQIYLQEQTIIESIRSLFERKSYWAGILVLVFSVCTPVGKLLLFLGALFVRGELARKIFNFINFIGKWSMADVFLVAVYTAYLAAKSSENVGQPIFFTTEYGPGFYWFAAYCIVGIAAQQFATALLRHRWQER